MKKILLLLSICTIGLTAQAQESSATPEASKSASTTNALSFPEPEFIGQVLAVLPGDKTTPLLQESLIPRNRATTTANLFGIGKTKKEMTLNSPRAFTRLKDSDGIALIVRVMDNQMDPMSEIMIFRFETTKKRRQAEYASIGTFGDTQTNTLERQPFTARKFGRGSYMIILKGAQPGEYGITVNGTADLTVSTFGID